MSNHPLFPFGAADGWHATSRAQPPEQLEQHMQKSVNNMVPNEGSSCAPSPSGTRPASQGTYQRQLRNTTDAIQAKNLQESVGRSPSASMDPNSQDSKASQQPTSLHPRDYANPTSEVSVIEGHDQPGSEMDVDAMAGSRDGAVHKETTNAAEESHNISRAPSSPEGTLVDPALNSSIPARPAYHQETSSLLNSSCAGGPQHNPSTAAPGQNVPSRLTNAKYQELYRRGLALHGRFRSGEILTEAESRELGKIKDIIQRVKEQSKKDQTARNYFPRVAQPPQANSFISLAPPQHTQNHGMNIDDIRMRFAHLLRKQKSHGLSAVENEDFRTLFEYLHRPNPARQQGHLHAGGNHAIPPLSRATSSQHQAMVPGSTPLVDVARFSTVSSGVDSVLRRSHLSTNNPGDAADAPMYLPPPEAQNFNVRNNSTQSYNNVQDHFCSNHPQLQDMSHQFTASEALPIARLADQKHRLYVEDGNEYTQNGNEIQNRAKRARMDVPPDANYSVGQGQPALKQTQNPGSDTTRLQEQPMITLPLGNLDPKVARETLQKAVKVMQIGGTMVSVSPGMKAFIVPQHSIIACRPQGSSSVFIGSSDTPDIQHSRHKLALLSFRRGLEASMQHQRKMQAGVPEENIKVVVFDDRENGMEPVSKPMQSSSINAKSEESTDDTTIARDHGTIVVNEDTQAQGATCEDTKVNVAAQAQCPDTTAGLKRPLSAVQEEAGTTEDSNQARKKTLTATPKEKSPAADNLHQAEQAKSSPIESTTVLPSSDERALQSRVASPEGQPSIPWVPTREEAKEKDLDAHIDKEIEIWNARPTPEAPDEEAQWREMCNWQDTDDEEDSPSAQVHEVDNVSDKDGQHGKSL